MEPELVREYAQPIKTLLERALPKPLDQWDKENSMPKGWTAPADIGYGLQGAAVTNIQIASFLLQDFHPNLEIEQVYQQLYLTERNIGYALKTLCRQLPIVRGSFIRDTARDLRSEEVEGLVEIAKSLDPKIEKAIRELRKARIALWRLEKFLRHSHNYEDNYTLYTTMGLECLTQYLNT